MARVRVHQHVNPLAKFYREIPVEPLNTVETFQNPDLPIHIDLGCGRGRFLLQMSVKQREWNYLGVEIREPLVDEANEISKKRRRHNLHYSFCNAPLDLGQLLEEIPNKNIKLFTIQFPDPWFKKRHAKRRMVNENLIEHIANNIADDGFVFFQTDVCELSEDSDALFKEAGFERELVEENILPVKTEREVSVENRKLDVFRRIYLLKKTLLKGDRSQETF